MEVVEGSQTNPPHHPIYYPYQLPIFYVLSVMMNTRTFPKATFLSVLVCYSYEWN